MNYIPEVDHYVEWKPHIQGWVYFKNKDYITIEVAVRLKDDENYQACSIHRNERVLVLCYKKQWNELKYVKKRKTKYEAEKNDLEMVGESTWGESDEK